MKNRPTSNQTLNNLSQDCGEIDQHESDKENYDKNYQVIPYETSSSYNSDNLKAELVTYEFK